MLRHAISVCLLSGFAVLAPGCGGDVIVAGSGGTGGAGGTGGGATTPTTGTGVPCSDHLDCPGGLCVFSSGVCSNPCDTMTACPQGEVCDLCGTSSCPECKDCLGVCLPAAPGACDGHDDCAAGFVCLFGAQTCAPSCTDDGGCADPGLTCDPCATSSCLGCENCLGACLKN
jgi:hypothetical protein